MSPDPQRVFLVINYAGQHNFHLPPSELDPHLVFLAIKFSPPSGLTVDEFLINCSSFKFAWYFQNTISNTFSLSGRGPTVPRYL